jgi:integrase
MSPRRAARDTAIVVLGFATALRRANLAALQVDDVTFCDQGMTVLVRREKQDKQSAGRRIGVPFGQNEATCAVLSLKAWLALRGTKPGPLFTQLNYRKITLAPLSLNAIGNIVKSAIALAGLDSTNYGPHSLRSGFITEAGLADVGALAIAQQSGHKSLDSLKRYFRPADLFRHNAASKVGL